MTEPACITTTRAAYDRVAEDYAAVLADALAQAPLERAMLAAFAELAAGGRVADVGCGPGRITSHLAGLGLDVFGVDLSPGMIAEARRRHPDLSFEVGSMTALRLEDGSLTGLLAHYSIIHLPADLLPAVFGEFRRVLAPGRPLMLAFQAGEGMRHIETAYGHPVEADLYLRSPEDVEQLLDQAGFSTLSRLVAVSATSREPMAVLIAQQVAGPTADR